MAVIDKKGALHGRVSNIVYRTWRDLQVAQIKPARVKQTIKSKEAGLEFGLCSSTARVLRETFSIIFKGNDGGMGNRLTSAVRKCVSACTHKQRGERDIHDAELSFLQSFQFNKNSPLTSVLNARPKAELDDKGKLKITMPAFKMLDIKGPRGVNRYIVRFLAVSFDFKKQVYAYHSCKEITVKSKMDFEGGELMFDDAFPAGRLLLVSMSIHALHGDGFGGTDTLNSKEWSPAELIGGWQLPGTVEEGSEIAKALKENIRLSLPMAYSGNEALKKMDELWKKLQKSKVPPKVEASESKVSEFELPKGDRRFKS